MPKIYVSATGQVDNIGDSILRRAMLDLMRTYGELHVYVSDLPPTYTDNLGLRPEDIVYTDGWRWRADALRRPRCDGSRFVISPGEMAESKHAKLTALVDGALAIGLRFVGGRSYALGMGRREPFATAAPILRWSFGRFSVVTWRDSPSAASFNSDAVQPDWAFAEGTHASAGSQHSRPYLVVSLRGDRAMIGENEITAMRTFARLRGLDILAVAQVERDNGRAREVARILACEVHEFSQPDHKAQEVAVRAIYAKSELVLSDRLHVLLVALSEGAAPCIAVPDRDSKAFRTLVAGGLLLSTDPDPATRLSASVEMRKRNTELMVRAQHLLHRMVARWMCDHNGAMQRAKK